MGLNFAMLKETEIEKAVNPLRKYEPKRIQYLVRELICGWRLVVDEYMKTSEPLSGIVLYQILETTMENSTIARKVKNHQTLSKLLRSSKSNLLQEEVTIQRKPSVHRSRNMGR